MSETAALVLFSGGQDSTVCLAWALAHYRRVETIGFKYGQRHAVELAQRQIVREKMTALGDNGKRLGPDTVLDLPALQSISDTALTRETEITFAATGLPTTFVPGRNLLFLTYAAALAYRRGITTLVGGMCETDFSGYPDCRNETIQTLAQAISLGLAEPIVIETPLMFIDKAGTWEMADKLGGDELVKIIIEDTHTCYMGDRTNRHDWGYGCGICPACELRAKGWHEWRART
ncbi:MAG: 7-cyano-7-deazaguanine synthase QueC [Hyphomicrobium sp.]|uniref:7-cyano-7-deazaguanine synthase QueC n=1 Tax=Hyphomicrobium sp. TaxID=82 RepID=UPI0039E561C0